MHVIAGLPRSGSTLICNVINQNPNYWATSTSPLPAFVNACISQWSTSLEVKSELHQDRVGTEERLARSVRALCEAWHQRKDGRKVFDKSRGWNHSLLALRQAFPESKAVIIVRDPRNVFASIEKQHQTNPLLDEFNTPADKSILSRADKMLAPNGIIGVAITGVEDMLRRKLPAMFIKYEQFSRFPRQVMTEFYAYLGDESFTHDFDNVVNTANDPDGFYNWKYPHQGSGKITPTDEMAWTKFFNQELADLIINRYPLFANFFGYK